MRLPQYLVTRKPFAAVPRQELHNTSEDLFANRQVWIGPPFPSSLPRRRDWNLPMLFRGRNASLGEASRCAGGMPNHRHLQFSQKDWKCERACSTPVLSCLANKSKYSIIRRREERPPSPLIQTRTLDPQSTSPRDRTAENQISSALAKRRFRFQFDAPALPSRDVNPPGLFYRQTATFISQKVAGGFYTIAI